MCWQKLFPFQEVRVLPTAPFFQLRPVILLFQGVSALGSYFQKASLGQQGVQACLIYRIPAPSSRAPLKHSQDQCYIYFKYTFPLLPHCLMWKKVHVKVGRVSPRPARTYCPLDLHPLLGSHSRLSPYPWDKHSNSKHLSSNWVQPQ